MPPPAPDAEIQAAARLLAEGRLPEALRRLGALTAAAPAYAAAHVLQAKALEADGRVDEALAAWHRAHFLVPTSPLVRRERQRLLDAFADAETYAPVAPREAPAPEPPAVRDDAPVVPPSAPAEPPVRPPADVGAPVREAPPSIAATALPAERPVPSFAWVSAPTGAPAPPVEPPPPPAGAADVPGGAAEDVFGAEDVFASEAVFMRRADTPPSEGTPDEALAEGSPAPDETWEMEEGREDTGAPDWIEAVEEPPPADDEAPAPADDAPPAEASAEEAPLVYAEADEAEILPVGEGPAEGLPGPPAAEEEDPFAGWTLHHVAPAEPEDGGQGWTVLDETEALRPEPPVEAEVAAPSGASLGRTPPDLTAAPPPEPEGPAAPEASPAAPDVADELDALIRQLADAPRIRPDPHFEPPAPPRDEDDDGLDDDLVSETLARIYAAQRQYAEAAVIYEKLARQRPEAADDYLQKAAELRTLGGPPGR